MEHRRAEVVRESIASSRVCFGALQPAIVSDDAAKSHLGRSTEAADAVTKPATPPAPIKAART